MDTTTNRFLTTFTNVTELSPVDHGEQTLVLKMLVEGTAGERLEIIEVSGLYSVDELLSAFSVEYVVDLRGKLAVAVTDSVSGFFLGLEPAGSPGVRFPGYPTHIAHCP